MPALHQNLRPAEGDGLLNFFVHLLVCDDVSVVISFSAIKGAEFAIYVADIRVVDVAIDDIGDDLIAAPAVSICLRQLPAPIGERAQFFQWQMVKPQRLGLINPLSVPD